LRARRTSAASSHTNTQRFQPAAYTVSWPRFSSRTYARLVISFGTFVCTNRRSTLPLLKFQSLTAPSLPPESMRRWLASNATSVSLAAPCAPEKQLSRAPVLALQQMTVPSGHSRSAVALLDALRTARNASAACSCAAQHRLRQHSRPVH
jgi:hypothetical protein